MAQDDHRPDAPLPSRTAVRCDAAVRCNPAVPCNTAVRCNPDRRFRQIAALFGAAGDFVQRRVTGSPIAAAADALQSGNLAVARLHIVDVQNVDRVFFPCGIC